MGAHEDSSLAAGLKAKRTSPPPDLPAEILAHAFMLGLPHISFDTPRSVPNYRLLLNSVCSAWRGIVQTTPALWMPLVVQRARPITSGDSRIMGDSMLEASARRSGVLELELYIECIDGYRREQGLSLRTTTLLASIIPRARILCLKTDGRYTLNLVFPLQSAPCLRRLEIQGLDQHEPSPPIVIFSPNADAPLELFDFWAPRGISLAKVDQTPVAHLKCLMATSYAHGTQYGEFLPRCKNLEILKLRECDATMAQVPLPPLIKVLELQYTTPLLPAPPFMPTPKLVHVTIRQNGLDEHYMRINHHEVFPTWPSLPLLETLSVHAPHYFKEAVLAVIQSSPKLTGIEINAGLFDLGRDFFTAVEDFKILLACPHLRILRISLGGSGNVFASHSMQGGYGDLFMSRALVPALLEVELYIKPSEVLLSDIQYYGLMIWLGWRDCGTLSPDDFPSPPLREVMSGRVCP